MSDNGYVKKKIVFDKGGMSMDGMPVDKQDIQHRLGMGPKGTKIFVKNLDTGVVKELHNMVLLAGGMWTAAYHWGLDELFKLPSYNDDMGLDKPSSAITERATRSKIQLWCMGNGGCGLEASQVYPVDYTKRIAPSNMIPFRFQKLDNDINRNMKEIYTGRKTVSDTFYAYYFKKPETPPTMIAQYVDGTPIDAHMFSSQNKTEAELYVETVLMATNSDGRDYYINTTGINTAVMNQFSLCRAVRCVDATGLEWFEDIMPVTQVNMNNEQLIDLKKGIEITYQTYY